MATYLVGRLEARFRSREKTEAHAAAHADRFAVELSDIVLHDADVLDARPRLMSHERTFRRPRIDDVRIVPADPGDVAWVGTLVDVEATDVEYHDVVTHDGRRFGRLTARVVGTLLEPEPEPEPPPPRPVEVPRPVAAPTVERPEIGTLGDRGGFGGVDAGLRTPSGVGRGWAFERSCSTSGCGLVAWPFLLAIFALLALLTLHAVAFVYHLVGRLWLLLGLPTVSGSGMPGWGGWLVDNVNWGGVLVLALLAAAWWRRSSNRRHPRG